MPQDVKADRASIEAKLEAHRRENAEGTLQGLVATGEDERALRDALERAFDYRGDVTLALSDGRTVEGYIFDRRAGETLASSTVRIMPVSGKGESPGRVSVRFDEIASVTFSGKDMAHGRSFERWVEQYVKKKLAGEEASIHSEPIEGDAGRGGGGGAGVG